MFIISSVWVILALVPIGCDKSPKAPTARPTVAPGPGIVQGIVRFHGEIPIPKIIGGDCGPGIAPALDESEIVNPDGTLKNVIVFIKDGPNIQSTDPGEPVLAQKNCRYVPHVMALRAGQILVITSHDSVPHDVHIETDDNPSDNFAEMLGASHAVHFDHPGIVRFKCAVHPWMTAYARVFDHPCYAVTGDNGKFTIARVPPGSYTLVAWQEKLGEIEKPFTVVDDKPVVVDFDYHQ
jgi:hypothetical protein